MSASRVPAMPHPARPAQGRQLISDLVGRPGADFALLLRPERPGPRRLDVLAGRAVPAGRIADIPLPDHGEPGRHDSLVVMPYRQIAERNLACHDDGAPLLVLEVERQAVIPVSEAMDVLPQEPISVRGGQFDISDVEYADLVRKVITEEIGRGAGANFVVKRSFTAQIEHWSPRLALSLFRRLLRQCPGSYWTFLICIGDRTLVGASPERHISLEDGTAVMNPISGTYRYPPSGPTVQGALGFLADRKEADELYMVADEELKVMGRVCDDGGRLIGPRLKAMSHLAHTEYLIRGTSSLDPRRILRDSMYAPTVIGSPLESACQVITRYEPAGRRYYAGVAALLGRDRRGGRSLDSAILIRTADIDPAGGVTISVGATLVRDSVPESEAVETRAKAAGLLSILHGDKQGTARQSGVARRISSRPQVRQALAERNRALADFWLEDGDRGTHRVPELVGRSILVLDAEDTFTTMGRHLLGALGLDVTVRGLDEDWQPDRYDLVVLGPGPGDPSDLAEPRIRRVHEAGTALLRGTTPFLAVCLGHQVLSLLLGLRIVRRPFPSQGVQRTVSFFDRTERVGFYNTFAAHSLTDTLSSPLRPGVIRVDRDIATGEVHALSGPGFASVQFHPASILTTNGIGILGEIFTGVIERLPA